MSRTILKGFATKYIRALAVVLTLVGSSIGVSRAAEPAQQRMVLWREPPDLERRSLFYGAGGEGHAPRGTRFEFVSEDLSGSSPKFVVQDADGVKWKIKLGAETRPETVASRIVWAVGYSVDEDYFLRAVQVTGIPQRVHRGRQRIGADGTMLNVRLKRQRDSGKRLGVWQWRDDPFTGTRELNGLRVLMAVINNWDLKDVNNVVLSTRNAATGSVEHVYEVSDLGASFGGAELRRTKHSIGNLKDYRRSAFIRRVADDTVDFEVPGRAEWIVLANPRQYFKRLDLLWIGRQIPRDDARWMGQMLARLSPEQIRDAFRAGGYAPDEVEGFAVVLEARIARLMQL